jgi:hypothetical protein
MSDDELREEMALPRPPLKPATETAPAAPSNSDLRAQTEPRKTFGQAFLENAHANASGLLSLACGLGGVWTDNPHIKSSLKIARYAGTITERWTRKNCRRDRTDIR